MSDLVLSLFPGIGLLDMAFELEGFCVVRGPDVIFGGDIRSFHPPAGKFDGVIGGPPCQMFSQLNQAGRKGLQNLAENLIPEFERCVSEAAPEWFIMENVPQAPEPKVPGYYVQSFKLNNRWVGGEQNRVRRWSFGNLYRMDIEVVQEALDPPTYAPCVTANGTQWDKEHGGRSRSDRSTKALTRYIRWQGLPEGFLDGAPLTVAGKVHVVGNGVPLPMGRAVARAVRKAWEERKGDGE